jgi:hypothetical protein
LKLQEEVMVGYEESIERKMVPLYESLNEKDRRRYAAVEAEKLPHGGTEYIARLFGCDPKTIRRGIEEVSELPADAAINRVRKKGAVAAMLAKRNRASLRRCKKKLNVKPQARL